MRLWGPPAGKRDANSAFALGSQSYPKYLMPIQQHAKGVNVAALHVFLFPIPHSRLIGPAYTTVLMSGKATLSQSQTARIAGPSILV